MEGKEEKEPDGKKNKKKKDVWEEGFGIDFNVTGKGGRGKRGKEEKGEEDAIGWEGMRREKRRTGRWEEGK